MICVILLTKKKKSWTEGQFEANSKQRSADWYRFTAGFAEPYRGLNKLLVLNGYFEKNLLRVTYHYQYVQTSVGEVIVPHDSYEGI